MDSSVKYFIHYKNKPYTYIGIARHSETLEEMVIYETRYPNDNGKVWVRPKEMFFETVKVQGETVPRFRPVPTELKESQELTHQDLEDVAQVMKEAFGEWDPKWFQSRLQSYKKIFLLKAQVDRSVVGFKLGYEVDGKTFYSWLGGVLPDYRGFGIASELMRRQHEWARAQGYKIIQTKSRNRFRDMIILNLNHGFQIVGTQDSSEGGIKILFEKKLC